MRPFLICVPYKWDLKSKLTAYWDDEGEGFAGPGLGRAEDVVPAERVGQGGPLDLAHLLVPRLPQGVLGLLRQR